MEYAPNGELFEHIVSKTRLPEKDAAKFYLEIINGIEHLHSLQIVHRFDKFLIYKFYNIII